MSSPRLSIAAAGLLLACASYAAEKEACETHSEKEPVLCSYEPNTVGYTRDSDDVGFVDFKISVRYQLFPDWITRGLNHVTSDLGNNVGLYFGLTGRLGQYFGTRESAPLIGKRFNPKLFFRYWPDETRLGYIDFAFLAHESNGQFISTETQYREAQMAAERPEFANDHISRGWDYLELVWKKVPRYDADKTSLSTYVTLKYFLPNGPLQGKPEEYNDWENHPEGKPRNQVNGVAAMLKYHKTGKWFNPKDENWAIFSDIKLSVAYETGYREIFRYNTVRLEAGTKVMQLPLNLWVQEGYGSDLAQYYKKVTSWGIEVQVGSF